jgi:hypothetical protein
MVLHTYEFDINGGLRVCSRVGYKGWERGRGRQRAISPYSRVFIVADDEGLSDGNEETTTTRFW